MQTYCGINLDTKEFYVGSTRVLTRRLREHENNQRLGPGKVFWLVSEEHDDPDRAEEQFYLDFYFGLPGCLNKSPNSALGNHPPGGTPNSPEGTERLRQKALGNTRGSANKGTKFYHDPVTKRCSRFTPGTEPHGWVRGNPKLSASMKGNIRAWKHGNRSKRVQRTQ